MLHISYTFSYTLDTCFVHNFDSLIPVIMLQTLTFKSSVLFGTHNLLDRVIKIITTSNTFI